MAFGGDFDNTARLADVCASITSADGAALQKILEELDVIARCCLLREATMKLYRCFCQCSRSCPARRL